MLAFRTITLLTASVSMLGLLAIPSEASASELTLCGEGDVQAGITEVMTGPTFTYEITLDDTIPDAGSFSGAFFPGAITSFKVDSLELIAPPPQINNDVSYTDQTTRYILSVFSFTSFRAELNGLLPPNYFGPGPYTIGQLETLMLSDFTSTPSIRVTNPSGRNAYGPITTLEICFSAPAYACAGFEPPLADGPVTVKKNRVLPLKAELVDGDGFVLEDGDLTAPPVVQVIYDSGIFGEPPLDASADALPAGKGTDGNLFVFTGSGWRFNLKTKNYEAPGTYTVTMVSGDGAEYRVEPTCEAQFVIE